MLTRMQDRFGQQDMRTHTGAWTRAQHAEATHAAPHTTPGPTAHDDPRPDGDVEPTEQHERSAHAQLIPAREHAGVRGVIAGQCTVSSNRLVIRILQGTFSGSQLLSVAAGMRVAKNPGQLGSIHAWIFKHLGSC